MSHDPRLFASQTLPPFPLRTFFPIHKCAQLRYSEWSYTQYIAFNDCRSVPRLRSPDLFSGSGQERLLFEILPYFKRTVFPAGKQIPPVLTRDPFFILFLSVVRSFGRMAVRDQFAGLWPLSLLALIDATQKSPPPLFFFCFFERLSFF